MSVPRLIALLLGGFVVMSTPSDLRATSLSPATEEALRSSSLIYVATQRPNGSPSKVSPIWFYYVGDGKLFFTTSPGSWKAKRIAHGSPLHIWVGEADGPYLRGQAEPVIDASLVDRMGKAYSDKYWIAWAGFFRPRSDRVTAGKTKAYMVSLAEGEAAPKTR